MSQQPKFSPKISPEKALFLAEFGQAVNELNQVLTGQLPAQDAEQLIAELSYLEPDADQY